MTCRTGYRKDLKYPILFGVAAILDEIGLPLLYIDAEGNRRELTAPGDVDETFSEVFDESITKCHRSSPEISC